MSKLIWSLVDDLNCFDLGESDARPGVWHNREALYLENGLPVLLNEVVNFDCFRLQAEIACPGPGGFVGLIFGARDARNYELVYVSPGTNSQMGEIQYDPTMNGSSTWQIYNGSAYQAPAPMNSGEWVKLTLDVQPNRVAISVGEGEGEVHQLVVDNLQHGPSIGKIGVWGYLPSYIRNLTVEKNRLTPIQSRATDFKQLAAQSFVTDWMVSQPYTMDERPNHINNWGQAYVEENGALNINRLYSSAKGVSVQANCIFHVPEEIETMLSFGFSDHLRLWVNEEEIYSGEWKWNPPGTDGRIRSEFASIPISWKAGSNTIRAEITSLERMFGWGLTVNTGLPDMSYINC